MPVSTLLIILLVVLLVAGLPSWPHAVAWGGGYGVPGILGIILIVVLILAFLGRL